MKTKEGFMLRNIAGTWVIVPLGEKVVEFRSMITFNDSGALLWKRLEAGADTDELVACITGEYDIDEATARADVEEFVSLVSKKGLIVI